MPPQVCKPKARALPTTAFIILVGIASCLAASVACFPIKKWFFSSLSILVVVGLLLSICVRSIEICDTSLNGKRKVSVQRLHSSLGFDQLSTRHLFAFSWVHYGVCVRSTALRTDYSVLTTSCKKRRKQSGKKRRGSKITYWHTILRTTDTYQQRDCESGKRKSILISCVYDSEACSPSPVAEHLDKKKIL